MNFRAGSGGASRGRELLPSPGIDSPDDISNPADPLDASAVLDSPAADVRQTVRANHNPPAASSTAMTMNKRFLFIVFGFDSFATDGARNPGSWHSIWNEAREIWCEAPVWGNEPHLQNFRIAVRSEMKQVLSP